MTLIELFGLLRRHIAIVLALPIVVAICAFVYAWFLPNQYTASTTMYVLSQTGRQDGGDPASGGEAVTQYDLNLSTYIANDLKTFIGSKRVRESVAKQLGEGQVVGYTFDVSNDESSRVITLSVTSADPQVATDAANTIAREVSTMATEIMHLDSVSVIDGAETPTVPSGPRRWLYVATGAMAGLFVAIALVVFKDLLDVRVRSDYEAERLVGVPVVGHFNDLAKAYYDYYE